MPLMLTSDLLVSSLPSALIHVMICMSITLFIPVEEAFEEKSRDLLDRKDSMLRKYRHLLWEEAMVSSLQCLAKYICLTTTKG